MNKEILAFITKIRLPIFLVVIIWVIEALDYYFKMDFKSFGIYPREWSGLIGILTSPFVHSNWGHLLSNTSPLLVLTSIMVIFYRKVAVHAFTTITIGTGLLVWLFARESFHIGASGVVYGLAAFVMGTGIFKKNLKSIILSLIALTLYSGMFTNMFPNAEPTISWESHLFGGMVGFVTSFLFKSVIEEDEKEYLASPWVNDNYEKQYFLPRDSFEKTKMQRYYEYLEAERQRIEKERLQREENIL